MTFVDDRSCFVNEERKKDASGLRKVGAVNAQAFKFDPISTAMNGRQTRLVECVCVCVRCV